MAETGASEHPPSGLFFAGSDDEETDIVMDGLETAATSSRASSPRSSLFLPDSDEDDSPSDVPVPSPMVSRKRLMLQEDESDSDNEIQLLNHHPPSSRRASSIHSVDKAPSPSPAPPTESFKAIFPPTKKRRLSVTHAASPVFPPTYLGEVMVPNAWSNVSGRGYIKPNDSIQIQRDDQEENKPGPSKPLGKKKGDNKKQMSLTAMLKAQPAKPWKKKKNDNIVRIINSRGFGEIKYCIVAL
jgi:DNA repair protein RAD5